MNLKEVEDKYTLGCYVKRPVSIVKGKDNLVWDDEGKEYIDCVTGIGSMNIGHCNPKVIEAVHAQMQQLMSSNELFYHENRAKLYQLLDKITPSTISDIAPTKTSSSIIVGKA